MKQQIQSCASSFALALASLATPALAQQASPSADPAATTPASGAPADAGQDTLQTIVVTASPGNRSKLDSSVSISSVDPVVIQNFHPQSEGDLLRLLPGLEPNVSGPGGNGNFAVRGLPVTTGGAQFVQLQEDGLPFVLYGDIQFGNNDYWTKSSPTDIRIEDIRGGTAATLASQGPGAIINYVSDTSKGEGGFIQLDKGVNYDYTKLYFLDKGIVNDSTYYTIGGFYDVGHGQDHASYNVSNSYLIKGNVTKEFADDHGYFRLLFKVANTNEPNSTGGEECGNIQNNTVTHLHACPGFDARNTSNYSVYNRNIHYVDYNGGAGVSQVALNGISTNQKAIQGQLHYKLDDGITLDENARYANISGGFASNFTNFVPTSGLIGSVVNGQTVAAAVYAAGPRKGQAVTEPFYNNAVGVYTHIRSLDNFVSDTKVAYKGEVGGVHANLTLGYFFDSQQMKLDWHPSSFNSQAADNPSPIELLNAAGNLLTADGYSGYNGAYGASVARTYDYSFTDNAPYADLILDAHGLDLDASVRHDINHGSGAGTSAALAGGGAATHLLTQSVVNPVTGLSNTVTVPYYLADGTTEAINYTKPTTSWSVGLSYKPSANTNVFIRGSKGVRFNSDRMTFNGNFNSNGTLNAAGEIAVTDTLYQYEIGLKARGNLGEAHFTTELTGFYSHFNITTQEISQTVCPLITGNATTFICVESDKYKSVGLESYSTLRWHGLGLVGNLTYVDPKEKALNGATATPAFERASGIADLVYSVAANYDFNDRLEAGLVWAGNTSILESGSRVKYPGSSVFSANLRITPIKNLEFGMNVYNLFNSFALLGSTGSGEMITSGTNFVGNATPAYGRTYTGSVKFSF